MPNVLTINGGSSSIRFAVFEVNRPSRPLLRGKMERVGGDGASLTIEQGAAAPTRIEAGQGEGADPVEFLMDWLERQPIFNTLGGAGHRIVHGMQHTNPARITPELLQEL